MHCERTVRIVNAEGLHARPCHAVVTIAIRFQACEFRVGCHGRVVDGGGIMTLMTLGAAQGDELHLSATGEGAEELVGRVARLIERGFEERSST